MLTPRCKLLLPPRFPPSFLHANGAGGDVTAERGRKRGKKAGNKRKKLEPGANLSVQCHSCTHRAVIFGAAKLIAPAEGFIHLIPRCCNWLLSI